MRRAVEREWTDNDRFAAGNSLTFLPHGPPVNEAVTTSRRVSLPVRGTNRAAAAVPIVRGRAATSSPVPP